MTPDEFSFMREVAKAIESRFGAPMFPVEPRVDDCLRMMHEGHSPHKVAELLATGKMPVQESGG